MKREIKTEMKNRIMNNVPVKDLTILIFNKSEYANLDWKEEKEFKYNEKMYDIVNVIFNSDKCIRVYCLEDKNETSLFALHEKQVKNNSSESTDGKHGNKLTKIISNYFFQIRKTNVFIPEKPVLLGLLNKTSFNSYICEIPSPPPELV